MPKRLAAYTPNKHLNFDALRALLSNCFTVIQDDRVQGRCQHSLHDAMMSAFAWMFFQDAFIAEFQRQVQESKNTNNLRSLFDVQLIPKDTQLRGVVGNVSSEALRPAFKFYFHQLQRAKQSGAFSGFTLTLPLCY
jgi:hypothetical protein